MKEQQIRQAHQLSSLSFCEIFFIIKICEILCIVYVVYFHLAVFVSLFSTEGDGHDLVLSVGV